MRQYSIFLMEPDVATDYFGKELLLFSLFQELQNWTSTDNEQIVKKQVAYITRTIPFFQLQQFLQKVLGQNIGFSVHSNGFELNCTSRGGQSQAILHLQQNCISLSSRGNFEAETIFFETLRKFDSYFLAVDYASERCGWLNPIKQKNYITI